MTPASIPGEGEKVYLKATANLSTGGTATDVTEQVHSYNVFMAERISRIIDLDICGIDIMTEDITRPLNECGAVLEVNAAPGFRMHLDPTEGLGRNVAEPVVDNLLPTRCRQSYSHHRRHRHKREDHHYTPDRAHHA